MVFYKPITDIEKIEELFPTIMLEDCSIYGAYMGYDEDDTFVGKALVKVNGYNCYLISVECDFDDKLLVEGFVRAALNFSANRSAYMAYCELEMISDVLLNLGFEENSGIYSGDIPSLLKGSCSCCK